MTQFARTNLSLHSVASSLHARALRGLGARPAWPVAAVLLFVLVAASVGLAWRGSTGASRVDSGAEARVSAVVDRLAERLKNAPDAEGWQTVGRSYAALGQHAQAVVAFRNALRLGRADATLLAEYAASAAVVKQRAIDGDPARLVARALVLDPDNPKALATAAALAMNHNDYAAAAEVMQVPVGTVRSRLFRGRRVLQESLVQFARDAGLLPPSPAVSA